MVVVCSPPGLDAGGHLISRLLSPIAGGNVVRDGVTGVVGPTDEPLKIEIGTDSAIRR